MEDAAIRDIVIRLSRPHASGGVVIERAAIMAEGADAAGVLDWISERAGEGETGAADRTRGLHGARLTGPAPGARPPLRYVLPTGALDE